MRLFSNKTLKILLCSVLLLRLPLLTSDIELKQRININKDGSGNARVEIAVQKELLFNLEEEIPEFKNELQERGWGILEEREKEGKHVIIAGRKFKDISELNDDVSRYTFSYERKGFLKKFYILEAKQIENSETPFPYEISIKVPGSIDETNGKRVSSDEAKWDLQGLSRGTELYIKSSSFAIPAFVLLLTVITGLLFVFVVVGGRRIFGPPSGTKKQGYPKGIFCTHCGKENPANASFCTNCGKRLG